MHPGELVRSARKQSGLSVRALATRADVAGSTITRIQSGAIDPTVETLRRILTAAGFDLHLDAIERDAHRHPRLADLVDAWSTRGDELRLTWTRWRAVLDHLALHPEAIPEAIYVPPPASGSKPVDALLAAVAEKLADDAGLPRPLWAARVPTLDTPYRPRVARHGVDHPTPPQLAARGLMIDAESLWRNPETVGA